jgi:hypothetical protein
MDPKTSGFDYAEPGIGRFTLLNFVLTIVGIFIIILIEKKFWTTLCNSVNIRLMKNDKNVVGNNHSNVIIWFLDTFIEFVIFIFSKSLKKMLKMNHFV